MPELLETIRRNISPETIQNISREIGASEENTTQAMSSLLPMLIAGLSRNASEEGARDLNNALERDHDGSLLDSLGSSGVMGALGGLLGGGGSSADVNPQGILKHILGNNEDAVRQGAAKASGLDTSQTGRLMAMLAPIVMGALGRVKRQQDLDAQGVSKLLQTERSELERELPQTEQGGLHRLLDSNQDGKIGLSDDVAKVGMALGATYLMGRGRKR